MPYRFCAGLLLAVVALAGCQDKGGAAPQAVATSAAAVSVAPSEPTGPSKDEVCKNVNKVLIDGSVEIADNAVKSLDQHWSAKKVDDHLRTSFRTMSREVAAEGEGVTDPELKAVVGKTAATLTKGGQTADPQSFLKKDFQAVTKSLDKVC